MLKAGPYDPISLPPTPSMAIVGPGLPKRVPTTLRTLRLDTSGVSKHRGVVRRIQAISGNAPIIPALLDHEATRGLPVCIDIPTFPCHPASQSPLYVFPGFLTPGKVLPASRWHLPAIPSDFLAHLALRAPECLTMSQNGQEVPWHSFSQSGRCQLLVHTDVGNIPIAKAPCAGRLILVAEALARAKCGLRLRVPGTKLYSRTLNQPITHLSVSNKE